MLATARKELDQMKSHAQTLILIQKQLKAICEKFADERICRVRMEAVQLAEQHEQLHNQAI